MEYAYSILAQDHVRFVEILSDSRDAPLQCRIVTCHLQNAPQYEALSYVWGPQQPLYNLQCTSDNSTGILTIGPNLYQALLHLRFHPSKGLPSRYLWIDRICINQNDDEERASQVLLMGTIYQKCEQVLAWLKEDDNITKMAFVCALYVHENDLGQNETTIEDLAQFLDPPAPSAVVVECLKYVAGLTFWPWFERAWTFQEAVLSSQVLLICGDSSMPIEVLKSCMAPASMHTNTFAFSDNAVLLFSIRESAEEFDEHTRQLPDRSFEVLLASRRKAKMLDSRDYVYSLLGLFSSTLRNFLNPDYTVPVEKLYTNAAKVSILFSGSLYILSLVGYREHLEHGKFPSWVTDWRIPEESVENFLIPWISYRATKGSQCPGSITLDTDELEVCGIPIGVLSQVGKYNDFHTISDFNLEERYAPTKQSITTALRQTLTLNFDLGSQTSDYVIDNQHPARKVIAAFYDLPEPDFHRQKCFSCPKPHSMPILSTQQINQHRVFDSSGRGFPTGYNENIESRSFFTADKGHIGFGPLSIAAGDQIFLLLGSDVPYILRPDGKKFKLIGPCYVHGIMYGEGLHPDIVINPQFYPGSVPGVSWDFSQNRSADPDVTWRIEPERGSNPRKTRNRHRVWLRENERDPLLIRAQKIVLK